MTKRGLLSSGSTVAMVCISAAAGLSFAAITSAAYAQEVEGVRSSQDANVETINKSGDDAAQDEIDDRIVVTGSRIKRLSVDTATPTVTIGAEELEQRGTINVLELLNELPAVQQSFGLEFRFGQADIGVQRANLRGLSTHRTLVVVNNRRRVTTNTETDSRGFVAQSFDLSVIPNALIERVDVVTGGASSIYGSDAVSGAINVILKDDFDGFEVGGNYGRREGGGYDEWQAYATAGSNFAGGRGNAVFHVEATQTGRLSRTEAGMGGFSGLEFNDDAAGVPLIDPSLGPDDQVPFFNDLVDFSLPGNTDRTIFVPSLRNGGGGWTGFFQPIDQQGNILINPDTGLPFTVDDPGVDTGRLQREQWGLAIYDPALGKFRAANLGSLGALGTWRCAASAGCEIEEYDYDIIIPQDRVNAYSRVKYEIWDNVSFVGEAIYSRSESVRNQNPSDPGVFFPSGFEPKMEIFVDVIDANGDIVPGETRQSPFFTDALVDQILTLDPSYDPSSPEFIDDTVFVGVRQLNEHGPRFNSFDREYISLSGGFEGEFANGWNWNVNYDWGRSELIWTRFNDHQDPALVAATDIVFDESSGEFVCRDATWRSLGCKPADLIQGISPEAVDFLTFDDTNVHFNEQQLFQAYVAGDTSDFFELPAGPVQFAVGVEWRETQSFQDPGNGFEKGLTYGGESRPRFDITTSVKEAYSEFLIPVVKDLPFARSIEIEGAVRVTDHNTGDTDITWKAGGTWDVNDDIRIRGMRARSVRSPSGPELFLPVTRTFTTMTDPCSATQFDPSLSNNEQRISNCMALLGLSRDAVLAFESRPSNIAAQGGNADLKSETADTITGGIVLTPNWAPGLTLLADYYHIEVKDLVSTVGVGNILEACAISDLGPDNQFCRLVDRDPTSHQITLVRNAGVNINSQVVEGVDMEAQYDFELADLVGLIGGKPSNDIGHVNLRAIGGWQSTNSLNFVDPITGDVSVNVNNDEAFSPKFTSRYHINYSIGNLSAFWGIFWVEDTKDPENDREYPGVIYHDASISYQAPWSNARITGSINNIFNTPGRRHPDTCCTPSTFDRGLNSRFFRVGFKVPFGG